MTGTDTRRLCPMMAMLSEGEDHCIGDGCMWFVKVRELGSEDYVVGCAVAFSVLTPNISLDVNAPEVDR